MMLATEKRLIDANALKHHMIKAMELANVKTINKDDIAYAIDNAYTVDAVEVVRCKDCEFWNDGWFPECTMGKCKRGKPVLTEPHHYCSYGVRRLDVPVIIKDESFVVKEETKK